MRDKYRAWDKTEKDIVSWEQILSGLIELKELFNGNPDIIPMQYIGLKDKNGKEIYDGDLLSDDDDSICQVEYIDGAWWFVNPFDKKNRNDYEFLKNNKYKDYWKDMKIIGNIYQNPELLK